MRDSEGGFKLLDTTTIMHLRQEEFTRRDFSVRMIAWSVSASAPV